MKSFQFPESVYVPTYGLTGVAYPAGIPPNETWRDGAFGPSSAVLDSNAIWAFNNLVMGPVLSWAQVSTIGLTKQLASELKEMDHSLVQQLRNHLSSQELIALGLQ